MTRELRNRCKTLLANLAPGQAVRVTIAGDQPFNRISYQIIGGMAHAIWGAGMYRLSMERGSNVITVFRLADKGRRLVAHA